MIATITTRGPLSHSSRFCMSHDACALCKRNAVCFRDVMCSSHIPTQCRQEAAADRQHSRGNERKGGRQGGNCQHECQAHDRQHQPRARRCRLACRHRARGCRRVCRRCRKYHLNIIRRTIRRGIAVGGHHWRRSRGSCAWLCRLVLQEPPQSQAKPGRGHCSCGQRICDSRHWLKLMLLFISQTVYAQPDLIPCVKYQCLMSLRKMIRFRVVSLY